jgi:hypothetical protein
VGRNCLSNRGKEAYAAIAAYDEQMIAPEKDVLHKILIQDSPCFDFD